MLGLGLGVNKPVFLNAGGVDPDAQAAIDEILAQGGSLTEDQQLAIDGLVKEFKAEGPINTTTDYWSKIAQWYMVVGGTANAHLVDLKSATVIGSFSGGWTHNVNGALGNGTNGYWDTTFQADNSLPTTSQCFYVRVGNNFASGQKQIFWGGNSATGLSGAGLFVNYPFGFNFGYGVSGNRQTGLAAVANTIASYCLRRNSGNIYADIDGVNYNTVADAHLANTTSISINARNYNGTIGDYCDGLIQAWGAMTYITQPESLQLDTIDSAFQAAMGR